ncbi:MAG: EAL domain-containing protein [Methylococcaceae bacterium]|nr:MAG: EAL domain-containing protein [Methylococcaceae bacterium]
MAPSHINSSAADIVAIKSDARLLHHIAIVSLIAGLIVMSVNTYWGFWYRPGGPGLVLIAVTMLIMLKRGLIISTASFFCWSVLVMVVISSLASQGLENVAWVAGPIAVLVSGWLTGQRGAIAVTLGSIISIFAMYQLQMSGFKPDKFIPLEIIMAVLMVANLIAAFIGIATATTFRHQMSLIHNARQQLNAIFNSTHDMIWSVDPNTFALTSFNHSFAQCMATHNNITVELGMTVEAIFITPERSAEWQQFYTRALTDKHHQVTYQDLKPNSYLAIGFNVMEHDGKAFGISVFAKDITEKKKAQLQIEYLAFHDALTGLANRRLGMDCLQHALAMATTTQLNVALLFVDIDQFKHVNDKYGHAAGDSILKQLAQRLCYIMGDHATVCRQSGNEFMIILPNLAATDELPTRCENILNSLRTPFEINSTSVAIACFIGASVFPRDATTSESLIQKSHTALTIAKQSTSNSYQLFEQQMLDRLLQKITMRDALITALERHEFVLHYQPQIDLASGRVTGAEALIRWQSPEQGLLGPIAFISIAEEYGLINQIGRWVLIEACQQAVRWIDAGYDGLIMAVNLSALQFQQGQIIADVNDALTLSGLMPHYLELELTESILLEHDEFLIDAIQQWRAQGIHLSIDDFGTGYSSMAYLKRLKVDKLKIDRFFVQDLEKDSENRAIVQAMLHIAEGFNLTTIAEGIETELVNQTLKEMGCKEGQGYLFAKPLSPKAFEDWLKTR